MIHKVITEVITNRMIRTMVREMTGEIIEVITNGRSGVMANEKS